MNSEHETRLAHLAVQNGYLTRNQLDDCLRRHQPSVQTLERYLLDEGYLTASELAEISRLASRPPLFAEIVQASGWATEDQVSEALRAKHELERLNIHRYVGEILVERRILSHEQVNQALERQGKVHLVCVSCGYRFNADHGAGYRCPECGRTIEPAAPREPRYGGWIAGELVGRGPSGVLHRARHERGGPEAALKIVRPEALPAAARGNYLFHAKRAAAIQHPNVVRIHEAGLREGAIWIVSDLVEGVNLQEHVQGQVRLPLEEAVALLKQIAAALGAAHGRGIPHGNLKPANVLVTDLRELRLTDFGLAAETTRELAQCLAPERRRYGPTPPADLYACGILWHWMLAGALPFDAATPAAILDLQERSRPATISSTVPELPRGADAIFTKLTFKEPSLRYRHAAALMEDLDRLEDGRPTLAEKELGHT